MMQVLDAVKSAIPDAANRPAGEVLEHVLGALRQPEVKTIDGPEKGRCSDGSAAPRAHVEIPDRAAFGRLRSRHHFAHEQIIFQAHSTGNGLFKRHRWDKCELRSPQRPQDFLRYLANGV